MKLGSLFTGIGGFDLAAEWMGWETIWQSDIDPYCVALMRERFPAARQLGDITTIDWSTVERPDIITGGFPCQDISYAGKGAGLAGARSGLWYEYARAIRQLGPRYVVVENVAALFTRGIDQVLGTLADLGYDAEWSMYGAVDVGAPHRRNRVWIVAYAAGAGPLAGGSDLGDAAELAGPDDGRPDPGALAHPEREPERPRLRQDASTGERGRRSGDGDRAGSALADAPRDELVGSEAIRWARERTGSGGEGRGGPERQRAVSEAGAAVPDADRGGCEREREPEHRAEQGASGAEPDRCGAGGRGQGSPLADAQRERGCRGDAGREDAAHADPRRESERPGRYPVGWAIEPDVGRVAHGVPARVDRLRGLGNAIVPACALPPFQRIAQLERIRLGLK